VRPSARTTRHSARRSAASPTLTPAASSSSNCACATRGKESRAGFGLFDGVNLNRQVIRCVDDPFGGSRQEFGEQFVEPLDVNGLGDEGVAARGESARAVVMVG